ncbi:hypothetical protein AGMMS49925_01790 [Deltaproteobacteria bacterium]|nr:hypothetical protein AGMMS49925_01790 [Deltaproteobacteria bacterium]
MAVETYTKESLIQALINIRSQGWIKSVCSRNNDAVGNTLEDLLGIKESNLSPLALNFVTQILLPVYGWAHKQAGLTYPVKKFPAND